MAWPTILPALVFREFDFFVRLAYLLSGSCSAISFFLCGKDIISSKLGSDIKLWLVLKVCLSLADLITMEGFPELS